MPAIAAPMGQCGACSESRTDISLARGGALLGSGGHACRRGGQLGGLGRLARGAGDGRRANDRAVADWTCCGSSVPIVSRRLQNAARPPGRRGSPSRWQSGGRKARVLGAVSAKILHLHMLDHVAGSGKVAQLLARLASDLLPHLPAVGATACFLRKFLRGRRS